MKHILITTDQIHRHGGIEKVMATKVNHWASLPDVQVSIITTEQNNLPPRYPLHQCVNLIDLGVNYNRQKSYLSLENIVKAFRHFFRQKAVITQLNPIAVISPSYSFDHFWLPFIKKNALLIKEKHSSGYNLSPLYSGFLARIKSYVNDWIATKYDHIIVLNEDEKQYLHTRNVRVIANPIELSALKAAQTTKQVIAAGRLSPIKGFDKLVYAWGIVHVAKPDWQLHIYGEDYLDTQQALQQQINALGLQNHVILKGSVPDIPKVMTDYSLYVMTSKSECFPMVLLEALSVGLPVVSVDCPHGPRNIVQHGEDGILVQPNDIDTLASVLVNLMNDQATRENMGDKAKYNIQRFSTAVVMQEWNNLLGLTSCSH
jgi:glycosyltransferase involved in cell wall biosynthesis